MHEDIPGAAVNGYDFWSGIKQTLPHTLRVSSAMDVPRGQADRRGRRGRHAPGS